MHSDDFDRDPALTLQLRSLLRPPADAEYWDGLEGRIMAQINAASPAGSTTASGSFAVMMGWWEPFAQWTRIGGVVAAAALTLTAWSLWQTSPTDARLQREAAVEALSVPLDSAGRAISDAPGEKTVPDLFRY